MHASIPGCSKSYSRRSDPVDAKLLDILVCPLCKGPLLYRKAEQELVCRACRLAYSIRDDIPVMLEDEARKLPPEEEV
jgi:uncharacterized protein